MPQRSKCIKTSRITQAIKSKTFRALNDAEIHANFNQVTAVKAVKMTRARKSPPIKNASQANKSMEVETIDEHQILRIDQLPRFSFGAEAALHDLSQIINANDHDRGEGDNNDGRVVATKTEPSTALIRAVKKLEGAKFSQDAKDSLSKSPTIPKVTCKWPTGQATPQPTNSIGKLVAVV